MVAVFRLLDTSLRLWSRGEVQRSLTEQASVVAAIFAHDLRSLHNGAQGDFLVEWAQFDVDADGAFERVWPRVRLVRQASAAELAILRKRDLVAQQGPEDATEPAAKSPTGATGRAMRSGLIEVCWAILPAGKAAPHEGVLWRGEQLYGRLDRTSYFAPGFFDARNEPPVGALNEVSGGLLWFGIQLATQTSIVREGWHIGFELADSSASWDAWKRDRPDPTYHEWNEPGAGMPRVANAPLLPRRVRLELEFERPVDVRRRTRTTDMLEASATSFQVDNGARLPGAGRLVLIGPEWMLIQSVDGDRVQVQRGRRGTAPVQHPAGERVHFGGLVVTEVTLALYNDDWNL
ncbi:MAG: hypothetical protein E2O39_06725 [Planctomycetota bacterium]|nr:MAG: hypothetical protein E2O39_06725 [Planctomycetota bacterium]